MTASTVSSDDRPAQHASRELNDTNEVLADGRKKLHGRAFWESLGSPKLVLAPMVDQSEYAWRILTRSFLEDSQKSSILTYTPMIHARIFVEDKHSHHTYFDLVEPTKQTPIVSSPRSQTRSHLSVRDGDKSLDRPLIAQFCANDPDLLLAAARKVEDFVDAVDLNLGCPQSIARKGQYGAFLQEDQDLIFRLVNTLSTGLDVPVTAKIRILETKEKTLAYAQMLVKAGASIITIHGRRREQKGHNTGLADWSVIRYVRENIPQDIVIFANGNILRHEDIAQCLEATKADGVMSAEGNLCNPGIFSSSPKTPDPSEYWVGRDGKGGWRMDAVLRKYLDIIYSHVLGTRAPAREPLFIPTSKAQPWEANDEDKKDDESASDEPRKKKQRLSIKGQQRSPSLSAIRPHLFSMLRPLISKHTDVRDTLARAHYGDMKSFEAVLKGVERAVRSGLIEYSQTPERFEGEELEKMQVKKRATVNISGNVDLATLSPEESSVATARKVRLPWWVCQPYVRPLPAEAVAIGALQMSKKDKAKEEPIQSVDKANMVSEPLSEPLPVNG